MIETPFGAGWFSARNRALHFRLVKKEQAESVRMIARAFGAGWLSTRNRELRFRLVKREDEPERARVAIIPDRRAPAVRVVWDVKPRLTGSGQPSPATYL